MSRLQTVAGGVHDFMQRVRTLLCLALTGVILLASARPAVADPIADKKAQAAAIVKRMAELREWTGALVEQYNRSQYELTQVTAEIVAINQVIAKHQADSDALSRSAAATAVKAYVFGGSSQGPQQVLDQLVGGGGNASKDVYLGALIGDLNDVEDSVSAAAEDASKQQRKLSNAKARQEKLSVQAVQKKKDADRAIGESEKLLAKTKGDIAQLVNEEEERRRLAAEAKAKAEAEARIARERAARAVAVGVQAKVAYTGPQYNFPAPSSAAARVVAAAKSQLGIPYRWATAEPGVNFDCSGLTMWAWAQVGVSMGHFTGAQWSAFPHVPMESLQPGDLVFFFDDVHHVGLFIGGGMMIEAPFTGSTVRYQSIYGGNYAGAVRPG